MANEPYEGPHGILEPDLTGRAVLIAPVKEITDANIVSVLQKVLPLHRKNVRAIKFLEDYEKGKQPILSRIKEVRPEINEKIVTNVAHEVTAFKTGFEFGDPITYALRDYAHKEDENREKEALIERMNEMFSAQGKEALDQSLANSFLIGGIGFRAALMNDEKSFDLLNLDPKEAFMVYAPGVPRKEILAGTLYNAQDEAGVNRTYYRCYTDKYVYDLESTSEMDDLLVITGKTKNGIGMIPMVEYRCDYQRMGCFERAVKLMDALNVVESDRVNANAQFVQSFLWFDNVDLDDDQFVELKDKGAIGTTSKDGQTAHIEYINAPLSQEGAQKLADDLYDKIIRITAIPGREQSTGGNTGQAIMLGGSGWQLAEEAADKAETIFKESDHKMLAIVLHILHLADPKMKKLLPSDVDIKFARNRVSNLLTKTQGLQNMLTAGIHPQVAITNSDLFSDPQQVYMNSIPYLEKWKTNSDTSANNQLGSRSTTAKVVDSAEG